MDRSAATHPFPGAPVVHRLNRAEYANAIRDLLALDVDTALLLPPDDSAYGFDNVSDVLTVSPSLQERYLSAARKISALAIGDLRLTSCRPSTGSGRPELVEGRPASRQDEMPCARRITALLARRAYRRTPTPTDLDHVLTFYEEGRREGSFDTGIQAALQFILTSPNFAFRVERDPDPVAPGVPYRISDIELASRLSYVATLLVEQGADPSVADVTGMTALYAAVNMNTLGDLPGRPAPRPTGGFTPVDVAQLLLAHGADPNPRLLKPILMRHHSGGDTALGEGATPLLRAAKTGDVAMMRLLLDRRADPTLTTKTQTTAVMFAAGPAGGGLGGSFPVTDADKIAAIALVLDRGVDINAVDGTGQSALHVAAGQAGERIVTALVQRGARLDLKDRQGRTPLDVAMGIGGRGAPVPRTASADLLRRASQAR